MTIPITTRLHGWGHYPAVDSLLVEPATIRALCAAMTAMSGPCIARGMGRSYGDASLATQTLGMARLDHLIAFDRTQGVLACSAGIRLAEILQVIVAQGWFLPVLPGTGEVSVGGAIAADIHGKNHHQAGSFCDYVDRIQLLIADGQIVTCSREVEPDLFHATAGGMGLTGIIVSAELRLQPIESSFIDELVLATANLSATLAALADNDHRPYVVAWIDVNQRDQRRGRGLVLLGEHAAEGGFAGVPQASLTIPCSFPAGCFNRPLVRMFNAVYHWRGTRQGERRRIHYSHYFFPLDRLAHWNRLYGERGFVQHQCVVPMASAPQALDALLACVAASQLGSPLAVLKRFGPGNNNLLSFPHEGLTLTIDLPMTAHTLALCARLDDIVVDHGGRLYLAKDASMSTTTFRRGYPRWERMQEIRARYGALAKFGSLQSARLGL